jgi:hypothetical protein
MTYCTATGDGRQPLPVLRDFAVLVEDFSGDAESDGRIASLAAEIGIPADLVRDARRLSVSALGMRIHDPEHIRRIEVWVNNWKGGPPRTRLATGNGFARWWAFLVFRALVSLGFFGVAAWMAVWAFAGQPSPPLCLLWLTAVCAMYLGFFFGRTAARDYLTDKERTW